MTCRTRTSLVFLLFLIFMLDARLGLPQPASPMLVTTDWLAAHLGDASLVVLDIGGDSRSYYAGHIPGAEFLALRQIANLNPGGWLELPPVANLRTALEQAGVGNHSRIVLYGDYDGLFAARAYFTLDYLGLGNQTAILDRADASKFPAV